MSVYSREMLLRSRDVDMFRRLRTSELFRLLQEASISHTEELGMGRDKTLDKGLLWILLLQRADIDRMPEYDEKVVLKSWPGKTMHLLFPRYYSWIPLTESISSRQVLCGDLWTRTPER